MRFREILSEAYRNLVTGTTRAASFGIVLAIVTAGLAIADARAIVHLEREAAEFVSAGASVRVLVAHGATDPASCEELATISGVRAAGALKEAEPVVLNAMPSYQIPAYAVTPGLIEVLHGTPASAQGAWIPAQLAKTLRISAGTQLETTTGNLTIAGVYPYPDDGRDARLSYAILLPHPPTGTFEECWIDVWPVNKAMGRLIYAATNVSTESNEPVAIKQLNTSLGTQFNGPQKFAARPTRFAFPSCAVAGLILGFVAVRVRRLEIAGALHLGVSRQALLATVLIETVAWSLAALTSAASALVFASALHNPADWLDVYTIDIRGPLVAALTTHIGATAALLTIKERHLFGYFKDR